DFVCPEETHFLDLVLVVEGRLDLSIVDLELDDVTLARSPVCHRRFHHTVRRRPQLTQAIADGIGVGIGLSAAFGPRIFTTHGLNGSLIRTDRLCGSSARRKLPL